MTPLSLSPGYSTEKLYQDFPEIKQAITSIRENRDFCSKSEKDPDYLQKSFKNKILGGRIMVESQIGSSVKAIILQLAITYKETNYKTCFLKVISLSSSRFLSEIDCILVNIFNNQGALLANAPQQAWRSTIIQLFVGLQRSIYLPEKKALLSNLLPPDSTYFLSEDQAFFLNEIPKHVAHLSHCHDSSLLLQKIGISQETAGQAIDFAITLNRPKIALEWKNKYNIELIEEQLESIFLISIQQKDLKTLHQVLEIEKASIKQEKLFSKFFSKHSQKAQDLTKLFFLQGQEQKYEEIATLFFQQTIQFFPDEWKNWLNYACMSGFYGLVEKILIKNSMTPEERGKALSLAAEKNHTAIIKLLWISGSTLRNHQNEMFYFASFFYNEEIIDLRLRAPSAHPISEEEKIKALQKASGTQHFEQLKKLLNPLICFPDYTPSSPGTSEYFGRLTLEQLFFPSTQKEDSKGLRPLAGFGAAPRKKANKT